MANWMKQINKSASHVLEPGEEFLAAQQLSRSSVVATGEGTGFALGSVIGGAAAHITDKRRAKREDERQQEVAETTGVPEADVEWPGSEALVAYTGRRLLFFGMKGLAKAGEVFLEIPRDRLARVDRVDVEGNLSAGRVKTMQVRFVRTDGTAVSGHAPNMGVTAKRLKAFLDTIDGAA